MEILRKFIKHLLYLSVALFALFAFSGAAFAAGSPPIISSVTAKTDCNKILVRFSEPVFAASNGTGNLAAADFAFQDGVGFASISSVNHFAGNTFAVLTMNANAAAGDMGAGKVRAVANNIFTITGALDERLVTLAASDATAPTVTANHVVGNDKIRVNFSEPVWTESLCINAYSEAPFANNTDFTYTNTVVGNATALSLGPVLVEQDRTHIILDLDANLAAGDTGNTGDDFRIVTTQVYDLFGNVVAATIIEFAGDTTPASAADVTAPIISRVQAVRDNPRVLVEFSEPVFSNVILGAVLLGDLAYVDTGTGPRTLSSVTHSAGNKFAVLTLSSNVAAVDYATGTQDTIAAANGTDAINDANGVVMLTTASNFADLVSPVLLSATINNTGSPVKNTLTFTYSEPVTITGGPSAGSNQASTTSVGDLTTAGTVAGFGSFATAGDATYTSLSNTVALNSASTTYDITLAGQSYSGSLTPVKTAGVAAPSGVFTPTTNIQDFASSPNSIFVASVQRTITTALPWDVTAPTTITGFAPTSATTTTANVGWTAGAHADHDTYMLAYRTTTGVSLTNGTLWHKVSDATLATLATTTTQITGLNSGTVYYVTLYAIDTEGNYSTAATEINIQTNSGAARDRTAPSAPTSVKAESKDGKAVLTWTDSTASDLKEIVILRGKNEFPVSGTPYAAVTKGVKTYTDNDVAAGNTVKYILRARDTSNNESVNSSEVSVVITAPTPAAPETPATPPAEEVTPPPAEEEPVVTPPVEKTAEEIAKEKKIEALEKKIGKLETAIKKLKAKIAKTKAKGKLKTYKKQLQTYQKQLKAYKKALEKLQG